MNLRWIPGYYIGYRAIMKIAHRYHWHYAPPIYPDGDTHLWCQWCGFRQTIRKRDYVPGIQTAKQAAQARQNNGER